MSSANCPHCGTVGNTRFHCAKAKDGSKKCDWLRCNACGSVIGQWSHICPDGVANKQACQNPGSGTLTG